jgi:hypothetical protein
MEGQPRPGEAAPSTDLALDSQRFGGLGGEAVALGGYIDPAIPRTMFRLRGDVGLDDNRPDRAEFFYSRKSFATVVPLIPGVTTPLVVAGTAGSTTVVNGGGGGQIVIVTPGTNAKVIGANALPITGNLGLLPNNPRGYVSQVDYQEVSGYLEYALNPRLSVFVDVPVRFLQPDLNNATAGLSDVDAGFKAALVADKNTYVTLQFRTYAPSGNYNEGLGTGHVSLEPGLLLWQRLSDKLVLEGELKDWIPLGPTDGFAGNVLRYGLGLSYEVYHCGNMHVAPVTEFVGWSVFSGKELSGGLNPILTGADGQTIVNAKLGVRVRFGEHSDIYAGYGRAMTGNVWYNDLARLEYRLFF